MMILKHEAYWDNKTLFLYLGVALISFFLPNAFIINIRTRKGKTKVPIGLIANTVILILLRGFSAVGMDAVFGYQNDFLNSESLSSFPDKSVEILYRVLNTVVFSIFHDYRIFLIIISVLTVLPIIIIAWKHRDILDLNIVIGLYACIWYFQGLSLLRIYLAASIALIAYEYEIKNKPILSLLWLVVSILFHRSTFILIIPWIIRFGKWFSKEIYFYLTLGIIASMFVMGKQIFSFVGEFGGRYAAYRNSSSGHIGFQEILYYVPIFLIMYYSERYISSRKLDNEKELLVLHKAYAITGFSVGILKYVIPIFGRMQALFLPLSFSVSYSFKKLAITKERYLLIKTAIMAYGIIRLYIYLKGYYELDYIMPYVTCIGG